MRRRVATTFGIIVLVLVAVRISLPYVARAWVNHQLADLQGYQARVQSVRLQLLHGSFQFVGITVEKTAGHVPFPFFSADLVSGSVQWRNLIRGSLVGRLVVEHPRLNLVSGVGPETTQTGVGPAWAASVRRIFLFRIDHVELHDGQVRYREERSGAPADFAANQVYVTVDNLTNSRRVHNSMCASAHGRAILARDGQADFHLVMDPLQKAATFALKFELRHFDLAELNPLVRKRTGIDVQRGTLSLFSELQAADGAFRGYVRPVVRDLQVTRQRREKRGFFDKLKEGMHVGADSSKKELKKPAAQVELKGRFEDPNLEVWEAVGYSLYNAFLRALPPELANGLIGRIA